MKSDYIIIFLIIILIIFRIISFPLEDYTLNNAYYYMGYPMGEQPIFQEYIPSAIDSTIKIEEPLIKKPQDFLGKFNIGQENVLEKINDFSKNIVSTMKTDLVLPEIKKREIYVNPEIAKKEINIYTSMDDIAKITGRVQPKDDNTLERKNILITQITQPNIPFFSKVQQESIMNQQFNQNNFNTNEIIRREEEEREQKIIKRGEEGKEIMRRVEGEQKEKIGQNIMINKIGQKMDDNYKILGYSMDPSQVGAIKNDYVIYRENTKTNNLIPSEIIYPVKVEQEIIDKNEDLSSIIKLPIQIIDEINKIYSTYNKTLCFNNFYFNFIFADYQNNYENKIKKYNLPLLLNLLIIIFNIKILINENKNISNTNISRKSKIINYIKELDLFFKKLKKTFDDIVTNLKLRYPDDYERLNVDIQKNSEFINNKILVLNKIHKDISSKTDILGKNDLEEINKNFNNIFN